MRPELPAAERAAIEAVLIEASGRFNLDDPPLCWEAFALARMVIESRERAK